MAKPQRRDSAKEQFWRTMLQLWQQSHLSVRDFCDQQQFSEATFYFWRREIATRDQQAKPASTKSSPGARPAPGDTDALPTSQDTPSPVFVPVTLAASQCPGSAEIEVVLATGRIVRVRSGFAPELLRQLLQILEEPAC